MSPSSDSLTVPVMEIGFAKLESMLKASADDLRLQILQILGHDAYGVLELCKVFQIKQSAMSHHLKVLANAELVTTRREGIAIFYSRSLPSSCHHASFVSQLFATIDAQNVAPAVQQAIELNNKERSERSLAFFSENSERFKAQQELITGIDDYRDSINKMMDSLFSTEGSSNNKKRLSLIGTEPRQANCAIEIGPGEGIFLNDLSRRFKHLIALDNSTAMLEKCKTNAQIIGYPDCQLDFYLGDTHSFLSSDFWRNQSQQADCVVANMVLHHNANPKLIFSDCNRLLKPNGVLIICELCQHEQDWVRDAAGDVWLGFSETTLADWAIEAGFDKGSSSYTALRNGFRIQIHSYFNRPDSGGTE